MSRATVSRATVSRATVSRATVSRATVSRATVSRATSRPVSGGGGGASSGFQECKGLSFKHGISTTTCHHILVTRDLILIIIPH